MSERKNCNWCGYELIKEQVEPELCGACYRRWLVGLDEGASNEAVNKAEQQQKEKD
jgi:hypothetical protein|tara:strand:- start:167 stop:334 length:168 start_codon:yes stop_codon:yes gene_type:complete